MPRSVANIRPSRAHSLSLFAYARAPFTVPVRTRCAKTHSNIIEIESGYSRHTSARVRRRRREEDSTFFATRPPPPKRCAVATPATYRIPVEFFVRDSFFFFFFIIRIIVFPRFSSAADIHRPVEHTYPRFTRFVPVDDAFVLLQPPEIRRRQSRFTSSAAQGLNNKRTQVYRFAT